MFSLFLGRRRGGELTGAGRRDRACSSMRDGGTFVGSRGVGRVLFDELGL